MFNDDKSNDKASEELQIETKKKPEQIEQKEQAEQIEYKEPTLIGKQPESKKVEFTGFSTSQEDVLSRKEEEASVTSKSHITFHEFEEIPTPKETGKKKFEEYFETNRASQEELKVEKKTKVKKKKPKKQSKRKQKRIEDFDDAKKRRTFKFKRKKYTKVEDFIKFLDGHYLDLDEIADKVLSDENFHGWLKRRSKRFDESIEDFKEIVEKIGN